MVFTLPIDVDQRPVVIDGAGTLGRRIAAVYAGGGSDVRIFDLSAEQREAAREHVAETQQTLGLHPARRGRVEVSDDLQEAVAGGWMVIEAVPERIDIKTEVFGDLDRLAEPDAILCSNSSSLPTSQMIDKVEHPERLLNTHYQQPPELNSVELMSCGKTDDGVIDALRRRSPSTGWCPSGCGARAMGSSSTASGPRSSASPSWSSRKASRSRGRRRHVGDLHPRRRAAVSPHGPRRPRRRARHRGALRRRARRHPGRPP